MESIDEYLSFYNTDFDIKPEDVLENGELSEKGKWKLDYLLKLNPLIEEFEKEEAKKLSLYDQKLDNNYQTTETECQEKFKTILANNNKKEDFKTEEQFEQYGLDINLSTKDGKKLLSDLLSIRVPVIRNVYLSFITQEDIENVRQFLLNSFPNCIDTLVLNFSGRPKSQDDLIELGKFIDLLVDISDLVENEIQIWNFSITADDLNKLVVNFCHCKKLWICWSLFKFGKDSLNFMAANQPCTSEVSFEGCGDEILNNWGENTDTLNEIMRAFKNSDIREKITQVQFDDCNIDDDKIEKIMNDNKIAFNK